jgi:hypothetical protein
MSESSDDDIPVAQLVASKAALAAKNNSANTKNKIKTENADNSASDSEDDMLIPDLIKKRGKEGKLDKYVSKKSKRKESSKSEETKSKPNSKNIQIHQRVSSGNQSTSDAFYSTQKGLLVQTLLVRWWYAMQWPKDEVYLFAHMHVHIYKCLLIAY